MSPLLPSNPESSNQNAPENQDITNVYTASSMENDPNTNDNDIRINDDHFCDISHRQKLDLAHKLTGFIS